MNHRFRGRTWSDNPEPEQVRRDPYLIERVSLLVAKGASRGRWEAFTNSRPLLLRFNAIGLTKDLKLAGIKVASTPVPDRQATALNLYLSACNGLQYFRRASRTVSTRSDLAALLALVGIKYHKYVPHTSSEVPAGRSHPHGIGADCRPLPAGV